MIKPTEALATNSYAGVLWHSLQDKGRLEADERVDRRFALEMLAICEEHAIEPDPTAVITILAVMLMEAKPDEFGDDYEAAQQWIVKALK